MDFDFEIRVYYYEFVVEMVVEVVDECCVVGYNNVGEKVVF